MKQSLVIATLCCLIALAFSQVENNKESIYEYLEQLAKEKSTFSGNGHKTLGEHVAGEELLEIVKILQPYTCCFSRQQAEVHFNKNHYRITRIKVINNDLSGDNSVTFEGFGGVGKSHVDIDFESIAGSGIHYTVIIHGIPENAIALEPFDQLSVLRATETKKDAGSEDSNLGKHEAGEVLLHSEDIKQGWTCCGWKKYAEIHFKKDNYRITAIEFTKLWDKMSAYYDIYDGIGMNHVGIYFRSVPYAGIWYNVKIYGVPA